MLAQAPYLRNLAALVLLGTIGAALVDYVFKAQAVETFGRGDSLLRFFALYYAGDEPAVRSSCRPRRARSRSSGWASVSPRARRRSRWPSAAWSAWSCPGLAGASGRAHGANRCSAARCSARATRSSTRRFRPTEKRAAKSIIDVGFDRLGDAVGGGLVRAADPAPGRAASTARSCRWRSPAPRWRSSWRSRLSTGYIQTLERSLLDRAVELDLSDVEDITTRTAVMLRTLRTPFTAGLTRDRTIARHHDGRDDLTAVAGRRSGGAGDPGAEVAQPRARPRACCATRKGCRATLVPHVIPLLAWDPVAEDAVRALRKVAEERVGELIDALLDPNQPFAVRRRLARVFSVCVSQRAVDGLLLGLDDLRFEVRFQCGRSLAGDSREEPRVRIDRERVFDVVRTRGRRRPPGVAEPSPARRASMPSSARSWTSS